MDEYAAYNSYQYAYNNQIVNTITYGIAINRGKNNKILNNRIVSSGKLESVSSDYLPTQRFKCKNRSLVSAITVTPWFYVNFSNCYCPQSNGSDPNCKSEVESGLVPPPVKSSIYCDFGYGAKQYDLKNFHSNLVNDNLIKWSADSSCSLNLSGCNNCLIDEKYISTTGLYCLDNSKYNYRCGINGNVCSRATIKDEVYEYQYWLKKVADNNIIIGVIPNGSDFFKYEIPKGIYRDKHFFSLL